MICHYRRWIKKEGEVGAIGRGKNQEVLEDNLGVNYTKPGCFFSVFLLGCIRMVSLVPPKCSWQSFFVSWKAGEPSHSHGLPLQLAKEARAFRWGWRKNHSDGWNAWNVCIESTRKSLSLEIYWQALSLCWTKTVSSIFWLFMLKWFQDAQRVAHIFSQYEAGTSGKQHRACVYSLAVSSRVSCQEALTKLKDGEEFLTCLDCKVSTA